MHLIDWRELPASTFERIWTEQVSRWSRHLWWDSAPNWAEVERERDAGRLPGLILSGPSGIEAWCFFLVHQGVLQIGAFEADSSLATRTLLDAVLDAAGPDVAPDGAMLFAFSGAPGLVPALVARGFDTEPYLYLVRDVVDAPPDDRLAWHMPATPQLPALLSRAYGPATATRPFARHGSEQEWRDYSAQLLGSTACGRFEPALSATLVDGDGRLDGAVVTTVIGPGTAHVAQVAVDPSRRGTGVANSLLRDVVARASQHGFERVSLLVSERNVGAVRLYARMGFRQTTSFIAAGRVAPPVASHVDLAGAANGAA